MSSSCELAGFALRRMKKAQDFIDRVEKALCRQLVKAKISDRIAHRSVDFDLKIESLSDDHFAVLWFGSRELR